MEIKSQPKIVDAEPLVILQFLSDAKNLYHLMPQEKISDWSADDNRCSFKVSGGFTITLIEDGDNGSNELYLKSGEESPFPFRLTIHLNPKGSESTEGYIQFNGEVNMFLKMMVEGPLKSLFDYMSNQLQAYYQKS